MATGETKVGNMSGVSGETYDKDKVASTFEAETAEADNKASRLILKGKVKISATNGTMLADRVEYDAKRELYKAIGKVTFESKSGKESGESLVGPMDMLFASTHTDDAGKAILDKVGTSENFFKQ